MSKFIRLDMISHWRGTEHISSFAYYGEGEQVFEDGISCYPFKEEYMGNLASYWFEFGSITESDARNMQITVFEGERVGDGSELEDVAICTKTIAEVPALPLYEKWIELKERFYDDMETDAYDEYDYIEENGKEVFELIESMI